MLSRSTLTFATAALLLRAATAAVAGKDCPTVTTTIPYLGPKPTATTLAQCSGTVTVVVETPFGKDKCKPQSTPSTAPTTVTRTVTVTPVCSSSSSSSSTTSTTSTSSTTSASSCPTPPSCNNLGFDWAYYNNSARNGDPTYSTFHPDSFKNTHPLYVATTPFVGGRYRSENNMDVPGPIYNSSVDFTLDFFALNHHAYLYTCQEGTFTFNIPYANDAVFLWTGMKAYAGWTDDNADVRARYDQPDHVAGSGNFSLTVPGGTYVPIRFFYGQAQYGGGFDFTITAPNGQVIVSDTSTESPYVVRYSCDRVTAPEFPPFGSEI